MTDRPAAAPGAPRRWAWCRSTPCRVVVYALVLACAAGWTCFYHLGEGTLSGDEAAFAVTTERMSESGDWVVPYIFDHPHLNATPLYNWLTLLTRPCFKEGPLPYRFWSAAFGVGVVLLTLVLGTVLFRPEAGLLAGLFVTTNRYFFPFHGARFGGMDAMLTFFVTAALVCYLPVLNGTRRPGLWWSLVGGCVGLAWLSKPPVMGTFFFATLTVHALCTDRRRALTARLRGPALALAVAAGVAGPWYVLLSARLGPVALDELFLYNSVTRAVSLQPHQRYDPYYYTRLLVKSSLSLALVVPALVVAGLHLAAGARRRKWGLLALYPVSLFLALSLARGQSLPYLYPAFPLATVLSAGFFVEPWPARPGWLARRPRARVAAAWLAGALAALVVLRDAWLAQVRYADPPLYPPWDVYRRVLPALERHEGRLILFGFRNPDLESLPFDHMFLFERLYYERHMPRACWLDRLDELRAALADGKPAVVILPQPAAADSLRERGLALPPEAQAEAMSGAFANAVLAFHGARDRLGLGELFRPASP